MNSSIPKFGLRFLTRRERTVRRVTKCETREIKKRLEPSTPPTKLTKVAKPRCSVPRAKPATLVKVREVKKAKVVPVQISSVENENQAQSSCTTKIPPSTSIHGRILQTDDLQKLSRLSCSHEFSLFHKEMKGQLITNEHQLAFLQTKLFHLKNEFVDQMSQHDNLQQIKEYFQQELIKNQQRKIKADEFITLANKFKQDIKQAIDKWLKKKEFHRQPRALSEYAQKRQKRIQELIQETIEKAKQQKQEEQDSPSMASFIQIEDQSSIPIEVID